MTTKEQITDLGTLPNRIAQVLTIFIEEYLEDERSKDDQFWAFRDSLLAKHVGYILEEFKTSHNGRGL